MAPEKVDTLYLILLSIASFEFFSKTSGRPIPNHSVTSRIQWLSNDDFDPELLEVGGVQNGLNFYVARTSFMGGIIPGRVPLDHTPPEILFTLNGKEYRKKSFEVLSYPKGMLSWARVESRSEHDDESTGSTFPLNAFQGGTHPRGNAPLYICKCRSEFKKNGWVIGKVTKESGNCEIQEDRRVFYVDEFEVLVNNESVDKSIFQDGDIEGSTVKNVCTNGISWYIMGAGISILLAISSGLSFFLGGRFRRGHMQRNEHATLLVDGLMGEKCEAQ